MPSLSGQQEFDRQQFNLGSRFEFIKTLGKGSYGIVCSAFDKHLNRRVAIKRISKLHDSVVLKRTVRELKLLRHLQQSPNVSMSVYSCRLSKYWRCCRSKRRTLM